MYCKKCGHRLTGRETVCPNCGAQGQPVEYSNGFWDLYQDNPQAARGLAEQGGGVQAHPTRSEESGRRMDAGLPDAMPEAEKGDLPARLARLEQQVRRLSRQIGLLFRGLLIVAGLMLLLAFFLVLHACGAGEAEQAVGPAQTRAEETETTVQTRDRAANEPVENIAADPVESEVTADLPETETDEVPSEAGTEPLPADTAGQEPERHPAGTDGGSEPDGGETAETAPQEELPATEMEDPQTEADGQPSAEDAGGLPADNPAGTAG